jgi:elongation factor G
MTADNDSGKKWRATITEAADGEGRFIRGAEGRRHHGHVRVRVEPNQRGKGIEIICKAPSNEIPAKFSESVAEGVRSALGGDMVIGHPAVDEHPIDDIIVHVVGGSYHQTDSSDLDFKMAGIFAMRDAMKKAKPVVIK